MKRSSIVSNWRAERWVVLAAVAFVVILFYLMVSVRTFGLGFPLDDSWIHLTYARNLAEYGEWAFRPGEPSAGSTSPLWTVLLSIGFLLRLAPYTWTYLMGWVVLTFLSVCAERNVRKLVPAYRSQIPWAGLFFVFAWHLTWSAVSGMETLLHGLIIMAVLGALISGSRRYLSFGLLTGLSVWIRPDGLTLLGPILFVALLSEPSWRLRAEAVGKTLIGFGSLFLPFLLFNLALSGNAMPNTFYAKQAEYGSFWHSRALTERIGNYLSPIIASPFLALIPGACLWLVKRLRMKDWAALASLLWVIGYILIYFASLPAYQHGRYIIPAFPVMYLWGVLGLSEFALSPQANKRVVLVWQVFVVTLSLAFTYIGAAQNANDVRWVETEMVATAKWVSQNLPSDAVLAVHDIGALGFYVQNPVIDMAGLISPEVVPFIRDEARLAAYLDANSADYLITFASFYPELTSQHTLLFQAGMDTQPGELGENIGVYRWE